MKRAAILLLLAIGCTRARPPRPATPEIHVHGALRAIMHEHQIGPVVTLAAATAPHVYGVGALADLRGEVLLADGTVFRSTPRPGGITVTRGAASEAATLLVTATVPAWTPVLLDQDVPAADLDARLEALARSAGLDPQQPFPVLIEGPMVVDWHVIDGARLAPGGDHAAHRAAATTGTLAADDATLVGFFSTRHQGVFTHAGERTHFHVLSADRAVMGHADRISVRAGSTVRLPGGSR